MGLGSVHGANKSKEQAVLPFASRLPRISHIMLCPARLPSPLPPFPSPPHAGTSRCGPCRQFTPELVSFYKKMNSRRGKEGQFQIVWVSRCRDFQSHGQYFTHMDWLALPFEEASGRRGQLLGELYKVKGIPSLVLLDEVGNVITTDARNKIPADKAGIGFPWRNPLATVYMNLVPRSLRLLVKAQVDGLKDRVLAAVGRGSAAAAAAKAA